MKEISAAVTIAPVLGWARSGPGCNGTLATVLAGISRVHAKNTGDKLLDIGCGTGDFTIPLGRNYKEVHGVDVSPECIAVFEKLLPAGSNYTAHLINAAKLPFPDQFFDSIVTVETLEHVEDLAGVAKEAARVLQPKGELVLTVPNRWYPVEGHGGTIFGRDVPRIPLITWFPRLHTRVAKARVFTVRSLDRLFLPLGFKRAAVAYIWPTFEHGVGGSKFLGRVQRIARRLYPVMRMMEKSPLKLFGSSVIVRYEKTGVA
jgi:SAM-dependent methyltransferase